MFSSPLHTCVHCISKITDPSSSWYTCTLWRSQWNVHWNQQSFDWFVTLLHYLFSNKEDWGFDCQTRTTNILSHSCPCSWKIAGSGGLCKIRAVWTVGLQTKKRGYISGSVRLGLHLQAYIWTTGSPRDYHGLKTAVFFGRNLRPDNP